MKHRTIQVCSNCGYERPSNAHCINCNAIGRKKKHQFLFEIGWSRPSLGEYDSTPTMEQLREPVDPPFSER